MSDGTESTLLRPGQWLPPNNSEDDVEALFKSSSSPDMYANYAVYLCSKACELISDRSKFEELSVQNGCNSQQFLKRWSRLWEQLDAWMLCRPKEMLPVATARTTPFPNILFAHWAAISSNQLYHTSCVLLLAANTKQRSSLGASQSSFVMWHVKRICGISIANPHEGCLNNAIQPLWIAGRLLTHSEEQMLVVKTIRHIEASTGWTASWRIRDLENTWGCKIRVDS